MNTLLTLTQARRRAASKERPRTAPRLPDHKSFGSPARTEPARIQWPTDEQMRDVSQKLARISREGRRCEVAGDYFKSGDLAFQMREIIRATAQAFEKCRRARH